MAIVVLLDSTSEEFIAAIPQYQEQFLTLRDKSFEWLASRGLSVKSEGLSEILDPSAAMGFFGSFLSGLGDTLGNVVLILFTIIFLLADVPSFHKKLSMNSGRAVKSLAPLQELAASMNGCFSSKTMVSMLTGFSIWLGLVLLDVEFAVLWGFLAFLLNFIPNIGSALAAIPAVLLSLLEADPLLSGMIIALYLVVNTLVGNVIEPAVMGQRVGLSTLAVFLSLIFWGWMFGPVGMLLSVPLTMVLKFIAQQRSGTAWLALLLSNMPAQEPEQLAAEGSKK
jgi:AI-2 transport protein TqsA